MIGSGIGGLTGIAETSIVLEGARTAARLAVLHSGPPDQSGVRLCLDRAWAEGSEPRGGDRVLDRRARDRRCARLVALGDADVMVAGGAESPISRIGVAGFIACRALSTGFNDTPEKASRPYDRDRDGFVMGEGAGMVVLESLEHAKQRGARIYAELIGYGLSGDAHHITAPAEDGDGAFRCMKMALARAGISPAEIDYINAHGTSTPLGDEIELGAVQRLVGNDAAHISMSSTKSSIGHLLGAAGAVEAIFSILAMRDGVAPPTINLDNPSVETAIDLVPHRAKKRKIDVVLSNSFGFGGTNASLVFRRLNG